MPEYLEFLEKLMRQDYHRFAGKVINQWLSEKSEAAFALQFRAMEMNFPESTPFDQLLCSFPPEELCLFFDLFDKLSFADFRRKYK